MVAWMDKCVGSPAVTIRIRLQWRLNLNPQVLSYGGDLPLQLPRVLKGFLHKIFIVPVEVYPGCCDKYGSLLMRS